MRAKGEKIVYIQWLCMELHFGELWPATSQPQLIAKTCVVDQTNRLQTSKLSSLCLTSWTGHIQHCQASFICHEFAYIWPRLYEEQWFVNYFWPSGNTDASGLASSWWSCTCRPKGRPAATTQSAVPHCKSKEQHYVNMQTQHLSRSLWSITGNYVT